MTGRPVRPGVRAAFGGAPRRLPGQHRRLVRRRRQRPVHRHRIDARHLGQVHRQLPQRAGRGPDHSPRPPLRSRPQPAGRQARHEPRPQQRRLARPRLPGYQQDPRPVQPLREPAHQAIGQLVASVEQPGVPLLERHEPQVGAARCGQARRWIFRRRGFVQGRQHICGRDAAAGGRHEQRAGRLGQAERAGQQLGGVLAGGAVDAPLEVTDRSRAQARRLGQFLLGQPGLGPQLPQQAAEPQRKLLGHGLTSLRGSSSRWARPTPRLARLGHRHHPCWSGPPRML